MTTSTDIYQALHARYPAGKWVNIQEAPERNISGRRCDFVAFGVWGSTNNEIIGHEVKVSRADWQKELQDPSKSEAFSVYCDRWYVVAPRGIVKLEEVRASWGVMELTGSGLKIRRQAEKREGAPLDRNMMASWMRRVSEGASKDVLEKARKAAYQDGYETGVLNGGGASTRTDAKLLRLELQIKKFENASGISIENDWPLSKCGEAVRALMNAANPSAFLESRADSLQESAEKIREAISMLEQQSGITSRGT